MNSKIKCENSPGQLAKKWITPDMIKLAELFNDLHVSFSVEHMEITYFNKQVSAGSMGWIGCTGNLIQPQTINDLPNLDEKNMSFTIKFLKPISVTDKEKIQIILDKIKVTPSHTGKTLKSNFGIIYTNEEVRYGVYKKHNFDHILKAMELSDEKDLMTYRTNDDDEKRCYRSHESYRINLDFVEIKPFEVDENCMWTFYEKQQRRTNTYSLYINLIAIDIKENFNVLSELVSYLKQL